MRFLRHYRGNRRFYIYGRRRKCGRRRALKRSRRLQVQPAIHAAMHNAPYTRSALTEVPLTSRMPKSSGREKSHRRNRDGCSPVTTFQMGIKIFKHLSGIFKHIFQELSGMLIMLTYRAIKIRELIRELK